MSQAYKSYNEIYLEHKKSRVKLWYYSTLGLLLVLLFLPWTQNIRARGTVTALRQEQRQQQLNTIIGGRVEQWYVKEGDFVAKGDTILRLSEVKPDYLDTKLVQRTQEQIEAKKRMLNYYQGKIGATDNQIGALQSSLSVKIQQLKNKLQQLDAKLQSDSMDAVAAQNDFRIASLQYTRQKALYDSGLVSLTQLESRNQYNQSALAKKLSAENKFFATQQEKMIAQIEFNGLQQDYAEKVSKAESDRFSSLSMMAGGEGDLAKLENLFASYVIRNGMYYVLAPQDGQIVKATTSGIGEIVKEGEMLVNIVPTKIDYAVELYVRPVDLPLISTGQDVRFQFDGFPAIVFSGWPKASYGTYSGIVTAVESAVNADGKFKVLIKENAGYRPWPKELKMGTGANGIALLKNVPIWYELWRNINSFPPDYYKPATKQTK